MVSIVYLLICSACVFGLVKSKSKIACFLLVMALCVVTGFCEDLTPGSDFQNYLVRFELYRRGFDSQEPLYRYAMTLAASLFDDYALLKQLVGIVEVLFMFFLVKNRTPHASMVFSLFLLYPGIVMSELDRFYMGYVLCLYAMLIAMDTYCKEEKGFKDFFYFNFILILAGMFHVTLLAFLLVNFIFVLKYMYRTTYKRVIVILSFYIFAVFVVIFFGGNIGLLGQWLLPEGFLHHGGLYSFSVSMSTFNNIVYHFILVAFRCLILMLSYHVCFTVQNSVNDKKTRDNMLYVEGVLCFNVLHLVITSSALLTTVTDRLFYVLDFMNYLALAKCIEFLNTRSYRVLITKMLSALYVLICVGLWCLRGAFYRDILYNIIAYNTIFNAIFSFLADFI